MSENSTNVSVSSTTAVVQFGLRSGDVSDEKLELMKKFAEQRGYPAVAVLVYSQVIDAYQGSLAFEVDEDGSVELVGPGDIDTDSFEQMMNCLEDLSLESAPRDVVWDDATGKVAALCTDDGTDDGGNYVVFFGLDDHFFAVHINLPDYCDDECDGTVTKMEDLGEGLEARRKMMAFYTKKAERLRDLADDAEAKGREIFGVM